MLSQYSYDELNLRTELFRPLGTRQRSTEEMRPNLIAMEIKIVMMKKGKLGVRSPNVSVLLVSFAPFCCTRRLFRISRVTLVDSLS